MGIYIVNCEYKFNTRGQHDIIFCKKKPQTNQVSHMLTSGAAPGCVPARNISLTQCPSILMRRKRLLLVVSLSPQ